MVGQQIRRDTPTGVIPVALIYTRVSSEDQAKEGLSLEAQLADCRRYVAQHGWIIGGEYQDVMTGTRADRPQYQALLMEARHLRSERKTVVVVVKWLHRFGRRLAERVRCWEEFKALSVSVHTIAEGGLVSEFVANILASVAQEEARQISERVSETWKHARRQGWHMVGRAPWGYKWRARTDQERAAGSPRLVLEIDEIAAPYVREAFQRVSGGESARSVARWAAQLPAAVRQGESLGTDRVMNWRAMQRVLWNPAYIARDCAFRDRKLTPAEIVARPRGRWPALVDDDTWVRVQERIASHHRTPHQASGRYLLTGLIRCPMLGCGSRMHGMTQGHGPRYRCGAWARGARAKPCSYVVPSNGIDAQVLREMVDVLDVVTNRSPDVQSALRRGWQKLSDRRESDEAANRIERLEARLNSLQQRVVRATELLCDGQIDKARYDALCSRAGADADATSDELRKLRASQHRLVLPALDDVLSAAGGWAACFETANSETRRPYYDQAHRDVLAALIDTVAPVRLRFGVYRIDITWTPLGEHLRDVVQYVRTSAA